MKFRKFHCYGYHNLGAIQKISGGWLNRVIKSFFLLTDTKESAYVHALFSASLAHTVAKACMDGRLAGCNCAKKPAYLHEGKTINQLKFASCTNFLSRGIRFAQRFADAGLKRRKRTAKHISSELKQHNYKIGRQV